MWQASGLWLLLLLLCVDANKGRGGCTFFGDREPTPVGIAAPMRNHGIAFSSSCGPLLQQPQLANCSWYSGSSCCKQAYSLALAS
jgi:hypothetical protein